MSVSLYYTAKRDTHLSKQEKSICNTIIDTYISKYSLGEMYEPFCVKMGYGRTKAAQRL